MDMSQMCTGAGDYFRTSKPHSEKLCYKMSNEKVTKCVMISSTGLLHHKIAQNFGGLIKFADL